MKQNILILHGALGAKTQLQPLSELLSQDYNVHSFNFEGHGERTSEYPFSIERFSDNVIAYMTENNLVKPLVFGYSMGGYVALYTESKHPGSFSKIITLGTKFNWNPESAAKEVRMLNPDKIEEKVPKFAQHLQRLHAPNDWKQNMQKTANMMLEMGNQPPLNNQLLSTVATPVKLLLGTEDAMVTKAETEAVASALSNVNFESLINTEHPIEKVNPEVLQSIILKA